MYQSTEAFAERPPRTLAMLDLLDRQLLLWVGHGTVPLSDSESAS